MLNIFKDSITKIIQCNKKTDNKQKCCNFLNLKK